MSVQVFTTCHTALDSLWQSGRPDVPCSGKGEYLLKGILGWVL